MGDRTGRPNHEHYKHFTIKFIWLFLVCSLSFENQAYNKYCNYRFQFCIEYPTSFIGQGESFNEDGQIFHSSDRRTEIRAYGSDASERSLTGEYNLVRKDITVTYAVVGKTFFIISGTDTAGRTTYHKTVKRVISNYQQGKNAPVFQTLEITCPSSDSSFYRTYCKEISKSLQ